MRTITIVLLACAAGTAIPLAADEFSRWTWRVPSPPSIHFRHVVFAEGQFVAAGFEGAIITSTNGTNWFLEDSVTTNVLQRIMYGERYVASGNYGTVVASLDGRAWQLGNYINQHLLLAIAHGNETYVALDASGALAHSTNALAWTPATPPAPGGGADMVFGNGLFVAVGIQGMIITSSDGRNWVQHESGTTGSINSVVYGDDRFVAVGNEGSSVGTSGSGFILSSTDGMNWFLQTVTEPLRDVTYADGRFVILAADIGSASTLTSADGVYFEEAPPGDNGLGTNIRGVACGNGVCVAVGNGVYLSENGLTWTNVNTGPIATIRSFTLRDNLLVGAGNDGTILTTTNGIDFTYHRLGPESQSFDWYEVCHGDAGFVAAGEAGYVAFSADGSEWSAGQATLGAIHAVASSGTNFVGVAWEASGTPYGYFVFSTNGIDWEERRPFFRHYFNTSIAHGAGLYVAAGYNGQYFTSNDGLAWVKRSFNVPEQVVPICYLNGQFLAFGQNKMLTSSNGLDWTSHPTGFSYPQRVAYGNGVYLGVRGSAPDVIFSFTDATNWKPEKIGRPGLYSAIYAFDSFLVGGTVLESQSSLIPNFEQVSWENGQPNAAVFGRIGRVYELQSSTNLTDWVHEQDYTQSARHHPLPLPRGSEQRFYRLKLKH